MKFRSISPLLLLLFATFSVHATTWNTYTRNREGVKKFGEKSYYPAYQSFMHALEDDPLNPYLHLNIARALEENQEFEKAEQEYRAVLKLMDPKDPLRFETLFNLAVTQTQLKKVPEALANYQEALEIKPESIEVKTNIELMSKGGGGGEGDQGKPQDDKKDDKGKGKDDQQKDPKDQKPEQKQKQQPKPFESKDLSPQDVKKILDEIKNQEQAIRAEENDKGAKEAPRDKDW